MKAEILNSLGVLARRSGDQFSRLHLWLYGLSGTLDAMADSAGYLGSPRRATLRSLGEAIMVQRRDTG